MTKEADRWEEKASSKEERKNRIGGREGGAWKVWNPASSYLACDAIFVMSVGVIWGGELIERAIAAEACGLCSTAPRRESRGSGAASPGVEV